MKIAICEDDKIFSELVYLKIKEIMENLNQKCEIDQYYQGYELLDNFRHQYNIIFQDIGLLDSNGFNIAEEIRKIDDKVVIIFLTSMTTYVYDGYKVSAYRYILKGNYETELESVIQKLNKEFKNEKSFIILKQKNEFIKIFTNDIFYIVSELRKLLIVTKEKKYEVYAKLTDYEEKLSNLKFVRTHQGYLVNSKYIKVITSDFIILDDDMQIPISRKRMNEVKMKVMEYLR